MALPFHKDFSLIPGDVLCYASNFPVGWWIKWKTWSDTSHVEVFGGGEKALSSRSSGVGIFPLERKGLVRVLRPVEPFSLPAAMDWFWHHAHGQKYDWLGVVGQFYAIKRGASNKRMFCSEFVTRWLRAGGTSPVRDGYDADAVAPETLIASTGLKLVWERL